MSKYLSILYIIFFIYKYHDNHKNAGNPEKNASFLGLDKKKRIKNLYTSQLGDIEEENKKKNICVLTFGKRLQLVAPENRGMLLHVAALFYYRHLDSA